MMSVFFILLGVFAYIYLVFPVAMMLLAAGERTRADEDFTPTVAVLIPAANERERIAGKLANTLASRYPADRLQVCVVADGCTDGTAEVVKAVQDPRVHLLSLPVGVGKTSAINQLIPTLTAEILVLSDADVLISPTAVRNLVRHFADPRVGAVCGRRSSRAVDIPEVSRPARLHYRYESAIKRGEGVLGRVLGGDGSLYAMRRSLYRPLPAHVPDDFVNVLRVLAEGRRVVYENEALSWEELAPTSGSEFMRRRRTVARGVRGLWSVRGLLNPLRFPLVSFLLVSHKLLRWGGGFFLAGLLVSGALLASRPVFRELFLAQCVLYAAALIGAQVPGAAGKPFRTARYFLLANLAAAAGVIDVLLGRDWTSWRVPRATSVSEP